MIPAQGGQRHDRCVRLVGIHRGWRDAGNADQRPDDERYHTDAECDQYENTGNTHDLPVPLKS